MSEISQKKYTKEFQEYAAKLVTEEHMPLTDAARKLSLMPSMLENWVKTRLESSTEGNVDLLLLKEKYNSRKENHKEDIMDNKSDLDKDLRLSQLKQSADRLIQEHPYISNVEDAFNMIPTYISCKNKAEFDYLKEYIKEKYIRGNARHYDERSKG